MIIFLGTKAYGRKFAHCLEDEVRKDGIEVLCITPGFVVSHIYSLFNGITFSTFKSIAICRLQR
jgi:short-subunit dehydrogenase